MHETLLGDLISQEDQTMDVNISQGSERGKESAVRNIKRAKLGVLLRGDYVSPGEKPSVALLPLASLVIDSYWPDRK